MSNVGLLSIHTGETACLGSRKVFEVVASPARDVGLAGTATLGAMIGFGRSARVRRRHVPESDRAVVVDILGGTFAQGRRG
ncbi:DUF190 domain-containing protein [Sphingomonas sp. QA11]|uniref:DUF190 domain-containing protein n=1 Tax=Sphingomonas sp. QA11 TaxID=2950605 RepID=UPI002349037B|nr:DUF190 domain-containing protein [Sphingomonas sp. QA11]WCM26109.1 DUF190 domain-containing protein [Sphingomonas sp. QA11]